jgi:diguanylate cyclase (GGDEF)-like protein
MARTVENQMQALRESEQRVSLRTAELEIANASLARSKAAAEALNELLEAKVLEWTKELEEANIKLSELTVTDSLTGLSNRRCFDQVIAEEWMRASRTGQSLAILMIDVDHFKAYNDHYGHPAGDECLRKVASVLQANARRASDLVARYGGEEFVVVASDLDIQAAKELAETLRRAVEMLAMPHEFSPAATVVTISIGVSVTTPDANMQPESLLRMADAAMYYAKDGGRNRVAAWGSSVPEKA